MQIRMNHDLYHKLMDSLPVSILTKLGLSILEGFDLISNKQPPFEHNHKWYGDVKKHLIKYAKPRLAKRLINYHGSFSYD